MKRMKKLFAILMTMAMVMGLGITGFAATKTSATITVNDEDGTALTVYDEENNPSGVQLSYAQIIVPDTKAETGWAFVGNTSNDTEKNMIVTNAFLDAFGEDDAQDVIQRLLDTTTDNNNIATSNTTNIAQALSTIASSSLSFTPVEANPFAVQDAGVYMIKAAQEGYTYNTMAAYVGFGETEENEYPSLMNVELTAKRSPESVVKKSKDENNVVAVGDIVTYTIEAYVPFIDPNDENKTFKIVDSIYGANYYLTGAESKAQVQMGEQEVADVEDFYVVDNSFEIDLSDLITADNSNAGKKVTVTYTAKVTGSNSNTDGIIVENTSATHVGDAQHDSDKVTVYTGTIKLTKTDSEDVSKKLEGAGFEVRKDDGITPLTFTKLSDGVYVYDKEGDVTEVFTDANGMVVLKGLDVGSYKFKETTAPEGYHIASSPAGYDVEANLSVKDKATEVVMSEKSLRNSKLTSLPSTGGMGTTIFTIAGCVIMISAAGLFFASRRKAN